MKYIIIMQHAVNLPIRCRSNYIKGYVSVVIDGATANEDIANRSVLSNGNCEINE